MNKTSSLFGPWVIMVILPWLFPIVLIALIIAAAIRGSNEPLRTIHYWLFFSLIGLAVYAGIDFLIGVNVSAIIQANGA
jgi:ABC-type transport system involved in multi-copper enzyme maturation permease subunit